MQFSKVIPREERAVQELERRSIYTKAERIILEYESWHNRARGLLEVLDAILDSVERDDLEDNLSYFGNCIDEIPHPAFVGKRIAQWEIVLSDRWELVIDCSADKVVQVYIKPKGSIIIPGEPADSY